MNRKKVVLITGLSGAGKTSAMRGIEDIGYHCIDQYPIELLPELLNLIKTSTDPRYNHIALATNMMDFKKYREAFQASLFDVKIFLFTAEEDELLLRYKQSRKIHPLLLSKEAKSLEEAIAKETEMFVSIYDDATMVVDTTHTRQAELKNLLANVVALDEQPLISLTFISFGYKKGIPIDADIVFDVRSLPNPFWVENLRFLTGLDYEVYDYVLSFEETRIFIEKMKTYIDFYILEAYQEGKSHFTIGIGCTGGQHRSVSLVEYFGKVYEKEYRVYKLQRDIEDHA
jgi:Predicted P-loop-containing kinase